MNRRLVPDVLIIIAAIGTTLRIAASISEWSYGAVISSCLCMLFAVISMIRLIRNFKMACKDKESALQNSINELFSGIAMDHISTEEFEQEPLVFFWEKNDDGCWNTRISLCEVEYEGLARPDGQGSGWSAEVYRNSSITYKKDFTSLQNAKEFIIASICKEAP